jgi:hypothetical protein
VDLAFGERPFSFGQFQQLVGGEGRTPRPLDVAEPLAAVIVAGRAAIVVGMFPAGGAAGGGLFEDADQGGVIRLRAEEGVHVADGLQMGRAHAGPDGLELPLPFVHQMRRAKDNGTLGLTAGGDSGTDRALPRSHFSNRNRLRIRFQAGQNRRRGMFLRRQQPAFPLQAGDGALFAQAVQQTAVPVEVKLIHGGIFPGDNGGEMGQPALQEPLQRRPIVALHTAVSVDGRDVRHHGFVSSWVSRIRPSGSVSRYSSGTDTL